MKKVRLNRIGLFMFLHVTFCIYSLVSVFSKLAAGQSKMDAYFWIYYGIVLFLLAIYAILWQQCLKRMSLITAYSNKSVTIVWGLVWGKLLFKETITLSQIIGALIIGIGVWIIVDRKEDNT